MKQPKEEIPMMLKSGMHNYKMIIPTKVEQKIRFACQKVWNVEWSGTLFFTYEGSFENDNLIIKCEDIYIMDIGNQTYTEFDMNPDVISYMTEHRELLDCQIGLIHSHNNMSTFFSGTDIATLKEEGRDRNNFVSLIVNNAGTYTAAITKKIKSMEVKEVSTFDFFGDGEHKVTENYIDNKDKIEWFYLKIEKEENNFYFKDMEDRLVEIKKFKESRVSYNLPFGNSISNPNYSDNFRDYYYTKKSKELEQSKEEFKNEFKKKEDVVKEGNIDFKESLPYGELKGKPEVVNFILKQLLTCSILLPNESKVDIEKWAKNLVPLYERRFGKGELGNQHFQDWADTYCEFLTFGIQDKELEDMGLDDTDIQSIYAYDLIVALSELPENIYIKMYIEELEKYIIYE